MAGATLEFTDGNFQTEVVANGTLTVVDFWAPWCQPCLRLAPAIEALATEYAGKVRIGKLDTDQNMQTAVKYGISGIPTLLLFKNGQIVDRLQGAMPKDAIKAVIDRHLAN